MDTRPSRILAYNLGIKLRGTAFYKFLLPLETRRKIVDHMVRLCLAKDAGMCDGEVLHQGLSIQKLDLVERCSGQDDCSAALQRALDMLEFEAEGVANAPKVSPSFDRPRILQRERLRRLEEIIGDMLEDLRELELERAKKRS